MTSARIETPVSAIAGHATRKSPLRSLLADPVTATGIVLIVLFCLLAIFADLLAPFDPLKQNMMAMSRGPSSTNWLGTDRFGRDILSRVIHGARPSLALGITAPLLAGVLGTMIGMLAGYFGGWIDRVIGRLSDVLMAFPSLLIGIMIAAALGPGFTNLVVAIAFAFLPRFIRVARASTMAIRAEPYIDAAIASGQGPVRILLRHVLPNISGPLVVVATLWVATAIRIEASLSFLGLGTQPPAPSWGNIIRDGLTEMLVSPWPVLAAGLAITICVLAFNMVGDAIRDALDPETRD
ncbi:ABC transporter permease [Bosea sp. (in: a-proteobacteria)]|jgi:peptide/nickel transport system permease protein|uniref:ABC transporter permease n=1 Tax=Bosea sp. (in: a-proteobacteria) TaxID=1871050 RepID=UPI003F71A2DD